MSRDKETMMNWLGEIVSQEPWNEDELVDWANQYMGVCYHDAMWEDMHRDGCRQEQQIPHLKSQIDPYWHDPALPALPGEPDGALHGIGFIYDEDHDDRVLVAIEQLKDNPGLVALAEHEGCLTIYARLPLDLHSINVCSDEWIVTEFVPYQGCWMKVTKEFIRDCVAKVLGYHKSWHGEPPTPKQLAYLRRLGYEGVEPRTKGEAGALIAEYKPRKGKE